MQKALWLTAVIALGVATPADASSKSADAMQESKVSHQQRAQIDSFAKSYQDAWNSKDMDRLSRMYTAKAKPADNLSEDALRDAAITVDVVSVDPIDKNTFLVDQQTRISGASDPAMNTDAHRISVLRKEGKDLRIVAEREIELQPAGTGGAGMAGSEPYPGSMGGGPDAGMMGTGGSGPSDCPCAKMGQSQAAMKNCPCAMKQMQQQPGTGGSGQMGSDTQGGTMDLNQTPQGDREINEPPRGTKPPSPDAPIRHH